MKLDDLYNLVYAEHVKLYQDGLQPFYELAIYMSEAEWIDLMNSLPKSGAVDGGTFAVVQSHGKRVMGYRIHRVIDDEEHGVKIYRCGKITNRDT